jgi:hypothetical protein
MSTSSSTRKEVVRRSPPIPPLQPKTSSFTERSPPELENRCAKRSGTPAQCWFASDLHSPPELKTSCESIEAAAMEAKYAGAHRRVPACPGSAICRKRVARGLLRLAHAHLTWGDPIQLRKRLQVTMALIIPTPWCSVTPAK